MISTGKILLGALYISIAVAVVATAMLAVPSPETTERKVLLGGNEINVTIADTPALQAKGLGGRKSLKPNEGMLFIFPTPGFYGFWMKDMEIPIDIIWFDENYRIVDVWENATPDSYPKLSTPRALSQFVLEVPAGYFAEHHLKSGNILEMIR